MHHLSRRGRGQGGGGGGGEEGEGPGRRGRGQEGGKREGRGQVGEEMREELDTHTHCISNTYTSWQSKITYETAHTYSRAISGVPTTDEWQ